MFLLVYPSDKFILPPARLCRQARFLPFPLPARVPKTKDPYFFFSTVQGSLCTLVYLFPRSCGYMGAYCAFPLTGHGRLSFLVGDLPVLPMVMGTPE